MKTYTLRHTVTGAIAATTWQENMPAAYAYFKAEYGNLIGFHIMEE